MIDKHQLIQAVQAYQENPSNPRLQNTVAHYLYDMAKLVLNTYKAPYDRDLIQKMVLDAYYALSKLDTSKNTFTFIWTRMRWTRRDYWRQKERYDSHYIPAGSNIDVLQSVYDA